MHRDDRQSQQKLVSTNFFYSYVFIVICFIHVNKLIVVHEQYIKELKKKHGPDVDPRMMPFNMDASYAGAEVYLMGDMSKGIDCL
jgi:hypothetical protein